MNIPVAHIFVGVSGARIILLPWIGEVVHVGCIVYFVFSTPSH